MNAKSKKGLIIGIAAAVAAVVVAVVLIFTLGGNKKCSKNITSIKTAIAQFDADNDRVPTMEELDKYGKEKGLFDKNGIPVCPVSGEKYEITVIKDGHSTVECKNCGNN